MEVALFGIATLAMLVVWLAMAAGTRLGRRLAAREKGERE